MSSFPPPADPSQVEFPAENPGWPKTVGIVSIVWSSLGMLCGVCGVGIMVAMPALLKKAEEQMGPMPDVMKPTPLQMGLSALGFIPAILLMVAGIMTMRRKKLGAVLHMVYGALGLLLGLASIGYAIYHQLELQAWAQQNPSDKWAQNSSSVGGWIGIFVGMILGVAYPLFCLAWFGLIKRNADMGSDEVSI